MSNASVREYYCNNEVDLYLCTSSTEGTCYSVLEALSYGVPVCASAVGEIPGYLHVGIGFCINDREILDDFVNAVLSHKRYRSMKMRVQCQRYITAERCSHTLYSQWCSVLREGRRRCESTEVVRRRY